MLPAEELIRVVRVSRTNTENAENAEGDDAEQGNHADAAKDNPRRRKKERASHAARVVALDVSSFLPGAGAEALARLGRAGRAVRGSHARLPGRGARGGRAAVAAASVFLETETETETHTAGDGASLAAERAERVGSPRENVFRPRGRARTCVAAATARVRWRRRRRLRDTSPYRREAGRVGRAALLRSLRCRRLPPSAETLDGVDSSRWAFTREPGTPSPGRRTPWPWTETRARKWPASAPAPGGRGFGRGRRRGVGWAGDEASLPRGTRRRARDFGKTFRFSDHPEFRAIRVP